MDQRSKHFGWTRPAPHLTQLPILLESMTAGKCGMITPTDSLPARLVCSGGEPLGNNIPDIHLVAQVLLDA